MKRKSLTLCVLFFIGCFASLFNSCSKVDVIQSNVLEIDIVKFQTIEEYDDALNAVLSMSREERKNYEESKGYISFGRQCDEFYDKVDFDAFESIEEIKAFAASNDFIKLIEDENGEFILEKPLSISLHRYFINSDRLFQIGDFVYKIFEDGTASTHVDNLYKLVQNKSYSVYSIPEDTEITVSHNIRNSSNLKDAAHNCGNYYYDGESSGNYRVGIGVEVNIVHAYSPLGGDPISSMYANTFIRSFRKRWWGWAYSERWVAYESKVAIDLETASGWEREFHKKSETRKVDGTYAHTFVNRWLSAGYHYPYGVHFGAYDCSADMIHHPGVDIKYDCNKHIFPWGF